MTGKILGFDEIENNGMISADNGQRYTFNKDDWEDYKIIPSKNLKVDFEITEDNKAIRIYIINDQTLENTNTFFGLISLGITFFLGFIGTFISRVVLAKHSIGEALIPTLIHFLLTLILFIPFIGWLVYIIGTVYYMYKNYVLIDNK